MKFYEALPLMMEQGKKIKRRHWGGYWTMQTVVGKQNKNMPTWDGEFIVAKLKTGGYAPATAYQEDLLADDWEVVE
jgi:hypothetical protein